MLTVTSIAVNSIFMFTHAHWHTHTSVTAQINFTSYKHVKLPRSYAEDMRTSCDICLAIFCKCAHQHTYTSMLLHAELNVKVHKHNGRQQQQHRRYSITICIPLAVTGTQKPKRFICSHSLLQRRLFFQRLFSGYFRSWDLSFHLRPLHWPVIWFFSFRFCFFLLPTVLRVFAWVLCKFFLFLFLCLNYARICFCCVYLLYWKFRFRYFFLLLRCDSGDFLVSAAFRFALRGLAIPHFYTQFIWA